MNVVSVAVLAVAMVAVAAPMAAAQDPPSCEPATFAPDVQNKVPAGVSADKPVLIDKNNAPVTAEIAFNAEQRTFAVSSAVLALQPAVRVRWQRSDGTACVQTAGAPPGPASGSAAPASAMDCAIAGAEATLQARAARRQSDFTVVLLNDLGVCYASRHFSTEGDPLYIGYARQDRSVAGLEFEKCEAASAIPKVLIGGEVAGIKPESLGPLEVQWFTPAAQCFGTSVQFHLNKAGKPKFASATITQYERYRATLQVGAVFSERHIESFGLRTEGDKKFLVSNGPGNGRGPEYVASVVVYGIPHYLRRRKVADPPFLAGAATAPARKDPYFGRDPVNESSVADRVGALMGVGMSQPGRRLVLGATFELVSGINLFGVREFVRQTYLNEASVGDEFAGEAKDISLRDDWDSGWSFGISFDARYAVALFGRK